jgi:hypothetical protein
MHAFCRLPFDGVKPVFSLLAKIPEFHARVGVAMIAGQEKLRMRPCSAVAALIFGLSVVGCGTGNSGTPLSPREFVPPRPGAETGIITQQTDQNGTLVYGELHAPLLPDEYTNGHPKTRAPISPAVRQFVAQTQPSATQPAEQVVMVAPQSQPGAGSGTYQVVGTVICIVNGHPIYADKVLAKLETQLAVKARQLSSDQFKADATDTISSMVDAMAEDQKQIAAATEALGPDAKRNADAYAGQWLDEQIKAAGGSREIAKEKALRETGQTLDEQANDRRDQVLVQMFYQEKLFPLIQISPTDLRRYYEQHLSTLYTQMAQAKFRLIKISVADRGGADQANHVIDRVLTQLKGGKEFAAMAKAYNDDPILKAAAGQVGQDGWVQKGSFIDEDVENAVWKLNVGEYTESPIRVARDGTYCLAMLEAKKPGAIRPFDDQAQDEIHNTLERQQLGALRNKFLASLKQQSVRIDIQGGIETTVEMAMQRYPAWAAAK